MINRDAIRSSALKIIGKIESFPKYETSDVRKDWLRPPPLSAFCRLEPIGFGINAEDEWFFDPDDCTADLVWPLDVGVIAEQNQYNELSFSRVYSITPKQVRGYASRFSSFMVRIDFAQTCQGKLLTAAGLMAWMGRRWVEAQKRVLWSGRNADTAIPSSDGDFSGSDARTVNMSISIALRQRYEWAVALGLDGSPSIRFATDPTGMKEAFKVRDLPEGRDRREALINWVGDHWRQNRNDPEIEIYVRKHLRGAESFSWKGMDAEIIPAQFDVEERDKFAADRAQMKKAGTDRRKIA